MHFVASYPKSGNTWIRLVYAAYHTDGVSSSDLMQFDEKNGSVAQLMQYFDADPYHYQSICPFPIEKADLFTEVRLRPAAMLALEREVSLAPVPPLVRSHHVYGEADTFPLWNSQWTDKVVNPIRDPREICYLYANQNARSYEDIAKLMAESSARMDGDHTGRTQYFLSTWSDHVEQWLGTEDLSVLSIRYEDLRRHPVDIFCDIFDFLDVPEIDKSRIQESVEKTRFDTLQATGAESRSSEVHGGQERFFRSSETDEWKDELPTDVARKIEQDHGRVMEALGYL
ncbi:sulfotransferase domain-containing protein [Salinibacter ruber]|uniref:sulfotransferase domain-containing protein n=1 Tax=Salinibacter ruber TaxID=146919 RepID=UPI0021686A11|nr:sulfotransferase domain-containing protein [Salinibacter ruber]MCS3696435.1 hypothetical protein [Salinibacter ruber]